MGEYGMRRYDFNDGAVTGLWGALQFTEDTVIANIAAITRGFSEGDWTTGTIPSGLIVPGKFTGLTLTSGAVICYNYGN